MNPAAYQQIVDGDEEEDSIGEFSEATIGHIKKHLTREPRRESFSSITSIPSRQQFTQAYRNLQEVFMRESFQMDSPTDLSPNAPPRGHFGEQPEEPVVDGQGLASSLGSVDSSGFEKVDASSALLDEYSSQFASQLQQSVYGALPDDPDQGWGEVESEADFVLVPPSSQTDGNLLHRQPTGALRGEARAPTQLQLLRRQSTEFEHWRRGEMDSPAHPVDSLEKSYGDVEVPFNQTVDSVKDAAAQAQPAVADLLGGFADKTDDVKDDLLDAGHAAGDSLAALEEKAVDVADEATHNKDDVLEKASDMTESALHSFGGAAHAVEEKAAAVKDDVSAAVHDAGEKLEEKASDVKEEVAAAAHDAGEKADHKADDFFGADKEESKPVVEDIDDKVDNLHNEVDALFAKMDDDKVSEPVVEEAASHPEQQPAHVSPGGDSGRDQVGRLLGDDSEEESGPDFGRQTPDETTFDRDGPLTIPEKDEEDQLVDDFAAIPPQPIHVGSGFGTEPRPPTPPAPHEEFAEEGEGEKKPSRVDLGPAPPHEHASSASSPHSILKHKSSSGKGAWCDFKTVDPRVLDLIYWRDPKKSAAALSLTLLAIFIFAKYPIISVLSYSGLAVLAATLAFRLFKAAEAQIKKTGGENPFQEYLQPELSMPQDRVHEQVDVLVEHGEVMANQLRKLFLVDSIIDSVKFGLLLWSLTYIGAWFSGFALVILAVLGVFSIPKVYEQYQEPIDQHLDMIKGHLQNVQNILEEKLPFLKRAVAEEKKEQ